MHDDKLLDEIVEKGFAYNEQFARVSRFIEYLSTIILPAIATVMSLTWPDKNSGLQEFWFFCFLFLVIFQILIVFGRGYKPETPQDLVYLSYQLGAKLKEANEIINRFKRTIDYGASFFQIERQLHLWSHPSLSSAMIKNKKVVLTRLQWMIEEISNDRYELFGMLNDLWSFRVYLFNEKNKQLESVAKVHCDKHPSYGTAGRAWEEGQGHVGKAYMDGKALITEDSHLVWDFIKNGDENETRDKELYRSFASIPIMIPEVDGEEKPIGVVVATSNKVNRFNKGNCIALELLAARIGVMLSIEGVEVFDER